MVIGFKEMVIMEDSDICQPESVLLLFIVIKLFPGTW